MRSVYFAPAGDAIRRAKLSTLDAEPVEPWMADRESFVQLDWSWVLESEYWEDSYSIARLPESWAPSSSSGSDDIKRVDADRPMTEALLLPPADVDRAGKPPSHAETSNGSSLSSEPNTSTLLDQFPLPCTNVSSARDPLLNIEAKPARRSRRGRGDFAKYFPLRLCLLVASSKPGFSRLWLSFAIHKRPKGVYLESQDGLLRQQLSFDAPKKHRGSFDDLLEVQNAHGRPTTLSWALSSVQPPADQDEMGALYGSYGDCFDGYSTAHGAKKDLAPSLRSMISTRTSGV